MLRVGGAGLDLLVLGSGGGSGEERDEGLKTLSLRLAGGNREEREGASKEGNGVRGQLIEKSCVYL